jgi:hypothetical protein
VCGDFDAHAVEVFTFVVIVPELAADLFQLMNVLAYFYILDAVDRVAVMMCAFVMALLAVLLHGLQPLFVAAVFGLQSE